MPGPAWQRATQTARGRNSIQAFRTPFAPHPHRRSRHPEMCFNEVGVKVGLSVWRCRHMQRRRVEDPTRLPLPATCHCWVGALASLAKRIVIRVCCSCWCHCHQPQGESPVASQKLGRAMSTNLCTVSSPAELSPRDVL